MNATISVKNLLAQSEAAGMALWWEDGRVRWQAPRELDPQPWLAALGAHKADVSELLRARAERLNYTAADIVEFDRLLDRLAAIWQLPEQSRQDLREARRQMAPWRVREELTAVRDQVFEAEVLRAAITQEAE